MKKFMTNKKKIVLLATAICIIISVFYYISIREYSFYGNRIEKVVLGNKNFYSEIVSGPSKMYRGLGGRNDLCSSCAMLFRFSNSGKHAFWMKGMNFPLDIIWIMDNEIVYFEKMYQKIFLALWFLQTMPTKYLK